MTYLEDKSKRRILHENIRKNFNFLDSETTDDPNNKKIILYICKNKTTFNKKRKIFPDNNKKFLYFSLLKRNLDTGGAINSLSRIMKRTTKCLKFAGNKDKRGITTQKISLFNALPEEFMNAQKSKSWDRRIEVSSFEFRDTELRLGLLNGNQFSVVLRFIKQDIGDDIIIKAIEEIEKNGFITYFGMQRFGIGKYPTHKIGLLTLKKNWREVILQIIDSKLELAMNSLSFKNKEEVFEHLDEVIDILPSNAYNERKILIAIKKAGKNAFQQGFSAMAKQLQVLYPHAYQSYIWNLSVSERIRKYGAKILIGDIVKKKKEGLNGVNALENADEDDGLEIDENDDTKQDFENGLNVDMDESKFCYNVLLHQFLLKIMNT